MIMITSQTVLGNKFSQTIMVYFKKIKRLKKLLINHDQLIIVCIIA